MSEEEQKPEVEITHDTYSFATFAEGFRQLTRICGLMKRNVLGIENDTDGVYKYDGDANWPISHTVTFFYYGKDIKHPVKKGVHHFEYINWSNVDRAILLEFLVLMESHFHTKWVSRNQSMLLERDRVEIVELRRSTDKRIEFLKSELHSEQQLVSDAVTAQEKRRREILELKTENARLRSIACNANTALKELGYCIDMSSCQVLKLVKCPSIHVTVTKTEDSPEAMAGKCYSEGGDVISNA